MKLPAPLAHLANRPHGRYRLSCPVEFTCRGDEVAAQAALKAANGTGAGLPADAADAGSAGQSPAFRPGGSATGSGR
jgi:hypothetical protein